MRYQQGGSPHKRESRQGDARRLTVPNLAVWSGINSIEKRRLQLWGESIIRAVEEHRHRKSRRAEGRSTGGGQ